MGVVFLKRKCLVFFFLLRVWASLDAEPPIHIEGIFHFNQKSPFMVLVQHKKNEYS